MRLVTVLVLAALPGRAWADAAPSQASGPAAAAAAGAADASDEGDDDEGGPSKKEALLGDKARHPVRALQPRERAAHPVVSVRNLWTHEVLPLDPRQPAPAPAWSAFLRDHFTNQATRMDPRLSQVVLGAAAKFKASLVEVVSGYRSPKYNLMLRKKGHAVARESQHPLGQAVDFRVAGVATGQLYRFVRSLRAGGAGYYPRSAFVHADLGPVRTWVER